jgi:hypothetical protein
MPKQLLVPVKYKRIVNDELVQRPGGMLHDTNYARGASSRAEAAAQWAADFLKVGHNRWSVAYVMEVVNPFRARLRVTGYTKSGSSAYLEFQDVYGQSWPMFLKDATELLATATMKDGWIQQYEYETVKRGTAYGIRKVRN